ncbi:MAG: transcriptional coactivator p15/PC4 family protein [Bacillota bacterium]|nr:transcriptional coactivator p15/PC4 family protein [Bacillota bacterium]
MIRVCGQLFACVLGFFGAWSGAGVRKGGVVAVPRLEDLAREREEEPARARGEWVAEEVGAIPKNKREAVVVRLVSRDGRRFIDVREFYWARDAGEYRPSKQGVALDVSLLPELLTLLEEAGRKAGG